MLSESSIRDEIKSRLGEATVTLTDIRGDKKRYSLYVRSSAFEPYSPVEQHQIVYHCLQNALDINPDTLIIYTAVE